MLHIYIQKLVTGFTLAMMLLPVTAARAEQAKPEMLIYCGITMIRPMTEIARQFEQRENVKITLAQGGSEDLYQSLKKSAMGDLYLPGEPTYRTKYLAEGLLGDVVTLGYNQLAIIVKKGNPKRIKGDVRELLRNDISIIIGNAESGSVGKETKDVLEAAGIYGKVLDASVNLAPDSRGLNNAMKNGEADVILNWRATGFFPDNAKVVDVIDLNPKLAPPQALLLNLLAFSKDKAMAKRFMHYSAGEEGQAIFRKFGFLDNKSVSK
ncbi:MAG: molybdate ABC transporter substrate-binding protein [Hydrogenophilales bacterium 28-61-23]|nr:MAG: molybdate ABC transporter substrate-binding protein [Hydrogenophilales bacterium 28-61-23]